MQDRFAVIGGGSWGTALAAMLAQGNNQILVYSKDQDVVDDINFNHKNTRSLPDIDLSKNITASTNFADVATYENIVIASPSHLFCNVLARLEACELSHEVTLIIASKGMCEEPLMLFSEKIAKLFPFNDFAFIYGPNFAREVAKGDNTTITIGAKTEEICKKIIDKIHEANLNIEITQDIITMQIASIAKNIYAIESGIMRAKGEGENLQAAFISKALQEIGIIARKLGGDPQSLTLSSVVGDLVLTCYSQTSRNNKFGYELHKNNYSQEFIQNYPILVEGVQAARLLGQLVQSLGLTLPLIDQITRKLSR